MRNERLGKKTIERYCFLVGCEMPGDCERCGFWKMEDERRKTIPLTLCRNGRMRKLLHRKKGEDPEDGQGET